MDIIINANTDNEPPTKLSLTSQCTALGHLMSSLGFPPNSPPLADFLRQMHHLQGQWLIMEPIQWQATHNDAFITATATDLELSDAASHTLFTEIAAFLAQDEIKLHYHHAHLWLVSAPSLPILLTPPTQQVRHQSMMSWMKRMDETHAWQALMTAIQMLLSGMPVAPANGVWCYGAGPFSWGKIGAIQSNDEQLQQAFPEEVQPLSLESVRKDQIILMNPYDPSLLDSLKIASAPFTTRWFWNNQAYTVPAQRWWRRFGRT